MTFLRFPSSYSTVFYAEHLQNEVNVLLRNASLTSIVFFHSSRGFLKRGDAKEVRLE